tara:strand:+ start:199 stop:552 length:354 start_codon:yes stop_codon:yes gene_type:complete
MLSVLMRYLIYIIILIFFCSCKSDLELSMERGIQLYEWNQVDKSLLEFKYVINSLWPQYRDGKMSAYEHRLLARAHYNLGVGFAKLNDWKNAEKQFSYAYDLVPEQEYKSALNKVQK